MKILDKLTTSEKAQLLSQLIELAPPKHLPTFKNGKIIGNHQETSSRMSDNAVYGAGYNTCRYDYIKALKGYFDAL